MNKNLAFLVFAILLLVITTPGCTQKANKVFTEEESLKIARNFVENSPTYKFDGFDLVHKETTVLKCPSCWQFVFEFKSRHAGYGDRTGKILAEVITPHTAKVTVTEGRVSSAILDERWDMIKQEMIGQE